MNPQNNQFEDDEDCWVPLSTMAGATSNNSLPSPHEASAGIRTSDTTTATTSAINTPPSVPTNPTTKLSGKTKTSLIQSQLETRMSLKSNLLDHPIDLFWKRYLINLAWQVWELDVHIRLGLSMVVLGFCIRVCRITALSTWYSTIMVLVLAAMVSVGSFFATSGNLQERLAEKIERLFSPESLLHFLQRLDSKSLRSLLLVLLVIPTILEARTMSFLASVPANDATLVYNIGFTAALFIFMVYRLRVSHVPSRECLHEGLTCLYGNALLVTLCKADLASIPRLAPPFLTATGTLLMTYQDDDMEWISQILRQALRITLREVLSSTSQKVSGDEMLQLAMLRWIADYWASTPTHHQSTSSQPQPKEGVPQSRPASPCASDSDEETAAQDQASPTRSHSNTSQRENPPNQTCRPNTTGDDKPPSSASQANTNEGDVAWDDLFPMLSLATRQLSTEMSSLQQQSQPMNSGNTQNSGSSSTMNGTGTPFHDFGKMLDSFNVDERAEPAVKAYRQAVASFPPLQTTAFLVSILRRCPAVLALVWKAISCRHDFWPCSMILSPFVIIEYARICKWIESCEEMKTMFNDKSFSPTEDDRIIPSGLKDAGPMLILFSGDVFNPVRPSALLLVWRNILSSVSALEVGLTAARCADTTVAAANFADNIISLLQFGQEVQRHGLLHGLGIMVKEIAIYHAQDESLRHLHQGRYTNATLSIVDNAQKVSTKIHRLAEDDHVGHFIQPIIHGLSSLLDFGGTEESSDGPIPESPAVEILSEPEKEESATGRDSESDRHRNQDEFAVDELSDVMDEMEEHYRSGNITESQKSFLCEKLSQISSKQELQETREYLSKIANPSSTEGETQQEIGVEDTRYNPSLVMELVLTAYYRGLIDQCEKEAFCTNIANLHEQERCDQVAIGGMVRTLEAILSQGTDSPSTVFDASQQPAQSTQTTTQATREQDPGAEPSVEKNNNDSSCHNGNSGTDDIQAVRNEAWAKLGGVAMQSLLRTLSGSYDSGETQGKEQKKEQSPSTIEIKEIQVDNENDWVAVQK